MTRLDLSKPKKLELRLSPLLNQWTGASQPRLQFYSPTVEKTWNATVQFSSSRSLSHGTVKGRYIFFFSDWRVVWVVLISLLSYWSSRNLRPCAIVSSRGDSAYWRSGDTRLKFWIKPLKETDLGVAQDFFWPLKETMLKHRQYIYFYIFWRATLNETFTAKYDGVLPRTPWVRLKSEIYTPKRDDEQDKTRQDYLEIIWSLINSYVHRLYPNNLKSWNKLHTSGTIINVNLKN